VNVVCFLLGNSLASEFRRRGITQKKTYNNPRNIFFDNVLFNNGESTAEFI
jgi:hypothetical protein